MSQDALLQAKMYEEEIVMEISELEDELFEVRELIAKLSAEAADNPYWSQEDENGGRVLKPMMAIRDELAKGNRAEKYYAQTYGLFQLKGFIATLTEDVPAEHLRMYVDAQTRHFAGAIVGMTYLMAVPKGPDGQFMHDYRIPWWVNQGPYKSTMRLQEEWADPDKLAKVRVEAEKLMYRLDRKFFLAERQGNKEGFLKQYPFYVPK